jgi:predicted permease
MSNFLVIFFCAALGFTLKRHKNFPSNSSTVINSFIIFISLPCLVLAQFPKLVSTIELAGHWWMPVIMAWITFGFSLVFINLCSKRFHWSHATTGALILTAGLGNTSFVGFPILEALIGQQAIPIGILVDQPGSFLVLPTLGVMTASFFSGQQISTKIVFKRIFTFPPFIALIVATIWAKTGLHGYHYFQVPFEKIAATLIPLALFSVGFSFKLDWKIIKKRASPLFIGLFFKLILMPIFFSFFYLKILHLDGLEAQVIILESAMATMITSAIVAAEYHLDTELANLMVGISIPLSFITVPLWNKIIFH